MIPCECGYMPKSKTRKHALEALTWHRDTHCPIASKRPAILKPKGGRFDSRAVLELLTV